MCLYVCLFVGFLVSYESQNKQLRIPYAALNNMFVYRDGICLLRSKIWFEIYLV